MIELRQAVTGLIAAALSFVILFGSLALSLAEAGIPITAANTPTLPAITPKPGEPTFTASPLLPPTQTPTQPPNSGNCPPEAGWMERPIEFGETWDSIAQAVGISVALLREMNCLPVGGLLGNVNVPLSTHTPTSTAEPPSPTPAPTETAVKKQPQDPPVCKVIVPSGWVSYFVRSNDTLSSIGTAHGVSYRVIMRVNCLTSTLIHIGQRLYVPYVAPSTAVPTVTASNTLPPPSATTGFRPSATPVVTTPAPTVPPSTAQPTTQVPTSPPPTATTPPPTATTPPPTATTPPPTATTPPPTATTPPPTVTTPPPTALPTATPPGTEPLQSIAIMPWQRILLTNP